jgi:hypothetical protein
MHSSFSNETLRNSVQAKIIQAGDWHWLIFTVGEDKIA